MQSATAPVTKPAPHHTLDWERQSETADGVVLLFRGHLSEDGGRASAAFLAGRLSNSPCHVVLDVRQMVGYHSEARRAWQQLLWPVRGQIRSMRLVGGTTLFKMGVTALGLALGVTVELHTVL